MALSSRRTVEYLALVFLTTLAFTIVYNSGMAIWENRPQSMYRSLEIVIQSFTTTGYGEDAPWQTPQMHLLVIAMQLAGIGLILTAVDVFAVPWLRNAIEPTVPTTVSDITDHVIICGHTPRTETFRSELEARDRNYVFVEADEETANELYGANRTVVHGDPEQSRTLENAGIESAAALVADVADDTNASIALTARDANPDIDVVTLLEDASLKRYHRAAGVAEPLSPRQLMGESLAGEVPTIVTAETADSIELGEAVDLAELTVEQESELCGETVTGIDLRDRFGVDVIGRWTDGEFETPTASQLTLTAGTRLLVVGTPDAIETFRDATSGTVREFGSHRVIISGYGDSGRAANEALSRTESQPTILDIESKDAVDVVGDARDPAVLKEAGIEDASTLLITVGDDTTAIFTTLIARELNPDLRIVVRANEEPNVEKLYHAGADYTQSLATVSGRMLASTIFADEEVLAYDKQVNILRLTAPGLEGQTVIDAHVREKTGCTVVAIIRGERTITGVEASEVTIQPDDEVVVAGSDDAITTFEREFN